MDIKICSKCHQEKPLSDFYTDNSRTDKLSPWCRSCNCEYKREAHRNKTEIDPDFKKCSICGEIKPKTNFYKNKFERDHLQKWCKQCKPNFGKKHPVGVTA